MNPKPKTRPGFLIKSLSYLAGGIILIAAFSGRPDRLIQSERNKNNLPELLNGEFPSRPQVLLEFSKFHKGRRESQANDPTSNKETLLRDLELFILQKVPWESDWRNWEVREYIPTPEEIISKGKEDCDGRAILFTNLARALGRPDVQIVWSDSHVWARDKNQNNYLLYAPADFAETQKDISIELPEYGEHPENEVQQTGDTPPPVTLNRGYLEQFTRDILSMRTNRFVCHILASTFFILLAFCIPSTWGTRKENHEAN